MIIQQLSQSPDTYSVVFYDASGVLGVACVIDVPGGSGNRMATYSLDFNLVWISLIVSIFLIKFL